MFCASLSDAYRASSPDGRGLSAPNIHKRPFNPQTLPRPKLWLQAGTDAVRPNAGEIQKNHPKTPPTTAESSKRCIKRASAAAECLARLTCWPRPPYRSTHELGSV